MPRRDLLERTRLFAVAVLKSCRALPATREAQEAASQLRHWANSVRRTKEPRNRGRSRAEFQAKLGTISQKPTNASMR